MNLCEKKQVWSNVHAGFVFFKKAVILKGVVKIIF